MIYSARTFNYCKSTVKGAFPFLSWMFPAIPHSACQLAGIEERAAQVKLGIESCKAD